jgi:hypothetical protein
MTVFAYLGEWLARLGVTPVELARGIHLPPSYLSNLTSRKKTNPGIHLL